MRILIRHQSEKRSEATHTHTLRQSNVFHNATNQTTNSFEDVNNGTSLLNISPASSLHIEWFLVVRDYSPLHTRNKILRTARFLISYFFYNYKYNLRLTIIMKTIHLIPLLSAVLMGISTGMESSSVRISLEGRERKVSLLMLLRNRILGVLLLNLIQSWIALSGRRWCCIFEKAASRAPHFHSAY